MPALLCLFYYYLVLTFYKDLKQNNAFLFSFVLKPYVSQAKFPFFFKYWNQLMMLRRRKHVAARDSMGTVLRFSGVRFRC